MEDHVVFLMCDVPVSKGAAQTLGCSKRFEFFADPWAGGVSDFEPVTVASRGRTSVRRQGLPPVEPLSALVWAQCASYG